MTFEKRPKGFVVRGARRGALSADEWAARKAAENYPENPQLAEIERQNIIRRMRNKDMRRAYAKHRKP